MLRSVGARGAFPPDDCTVEPPVPVEIPPVEVPPRDVTPPAALPPLRFHLMPVTHHLSSHHLLRNRPHHLSQRASHRSLTSHHSRSRRRCSTRPLPRKKPPLFPAPARWECHLSPRSRQHRLPLPRSTRRRATRNRPCLSYLRSPLSARCRGTAARSCARRSTTQRGAVRASRAGQPQARAWQPPPTARSELTSSSTYLSRSSGMQPRHLLAGPMISKTFRAAVRRSSIDAGSPRRRQPHYGADEGGLKAVPFTITFDTVRPV